MNKRLIPKQAAGTIVLLSMIVLQLTGCTKSDATSASAIASSDTVSNTPVKSTSSLTRIIQAPCVLLAQSMVKLKPELGGAIESVHTKLGERVKSGQLLAVIKTIELKAQSDRLQILMKQNEERSQLLNLQVIKIQREWDVIQSLYVKAPNGSQAVSREAMALAEKNSELKLMQLQKQELTLQSQQIQRQLKQAEIRSPMDGVVLARNAEVGMVVASGGASFNGSDVLFEVGDPSRLKAECAARESDAENLHKGLPITLRFDGLPNSTLALQISEIAPVISSQGGMSILNFWADFQVEKGSHILPGMRGIAKLSTAMPSQTNSDKKSN